jgi:hypothetical protein
VAVGNHGEQWRVVDGLVIIGDCIFLPVTSLLVSLALAATHGAGHEGVTKTLHRLRADFHIPGVRTLVAESVRTYETC